MEYLVAAIILGIVGGLLKSAQSDRYATTSSYEADYVRRANEARAMADRNCAAFDRCKRIEDEAWDEYEEQRSQALTEYLEYAHANNPGPFQSVPFPAGSLQYTLRPARFFDISDEFEQEFIPRMPPKAPTAEQYIAEYQAKLNPIQ